MDFAETRERVLAALRAALADDLPVSDHAAAVRSALKPDEAVPATADEGSAGNKASSSKESKDVLELVVRMCMDELLANSKKPGASIESVGVPRLLDLAIELASAEVVESNTPFALLEDLF